MKSFANITAGFLFCWLATIECMCTPPINVTNRFEPFSPTLFVNKPPPSSCAGLGTGLHNITIRGYSVVELWCQSNKAFLVLPPRTSNNTNYSEYDGVRSFVCAVRLDPATLLVDVTDLTFVAPIQQIPVGFANAGECRATWRRSTFNVDLHGTVFQLANDTIIFAYGHQFGNESWISETFKVANGSVGGRCSGIYTGPQHIIKDFFTSPPPAGMENEFFCYNLQWCLQLALDVPNVAGAIVEPPCALPANLTGTLRCNVTLRDSPPPVVSSVCPPLPATTHRPTTQQVTTSPGEPISATATDGVFNLNSSAIRNRSGVADNTGAIVGGVLGALLMAAVVAVLVWFVIHALARQRRQQQHEGPSPLSTHDDDNEPPIARASLEPLSEQPPPANQTSNSQYSNRQAIAPSHSSHYGALSREEIGVC
jgi:hypothetical protein